jgi:hypothetical protein
MQCHLTFQTATNLQLYKKVKYTNCAFFISSETSCVLIYVPYTVLSVMHWLSYGLLVFDSCQRQMLFSSLVT